MAIEDRSAFAYAAIDAADLPRRGWLCQDHDSFLTRPCRRSDSFVTLSLGWILLVLLAAVMHAAWNVLVKFGDDELVNMTLIMSMAGVIALAFTPFVDFPDQESWIFLLGSL